MAYEPSELELTDIYRTPALLYGCWDPNSGSHDCLLSAFNYRNTFLPLPPSVIHWLWVIYLRKFLSVPNFFTKSVPC